MMQMQLMAPAFLRHPTVAILILCLLQAAGVLALPASTPTSTPAIPEWPRLLEAVRLIVSRWLNGTTAIIAIGVIVGLAAASFAVLGFDWKDYDQLEGPSERLINDEGGHGCQESTKHTGV